MNTEIKLNLPINQLQAYCSTMPIQRLGLFGSVLRDDFSAESDVDMLVEYVADAPITLLDMATQEIELSDIVGRQVDLRTAKELSHHFRQDVLDSAVVIYERN